MNQRAKSGGIRPLERRDLAGVASLYEVVDRSGSPIPAPGLARHFAETFLDHPAADDEIPSLVYEEPDGTISGFLGSHVRPFLFDGRPIRAASGGQLVTRPEARNRAIGFFLVREFLAGPQDLSFTDTATGPTPSMWIRLGGQHAHLASMTWIRVLRPVRLALELASSREPLRTVRRGRAVLPSRRVIGATPAPGPSSTLASEPLTPAQLAVQLREIAGGMRLRPSYDERFLEWLFACMAGVRTRGTLHARLVRGHETKPVGWYVYHLLPSGISDVLQVAAASREAAGVIDDLVRHARAGGAAALRGRLEPRLLAPLGERRCVFRYNGRALIHARNREIIGAIESGDALLTRMDGDYWMGHQVEPFARP